MQTHDSLKNAVLQLAGREDVVRRVREVYAALQREIESRRPVCVMSGRCCNFEEFGHRLYVTTIELAVFVHELAMANPPVRSTAPCPFQVNKLCTAHDARPFGCRVFFCDPTAEEWQQQQYERFHAEIKRLHVELNIPYFYVEWRQALRAIE